MRLTKNEMRQALRLYAVTDQRWLPAAHSLREVVASVLDSGATMLQIREKELDDATFLDEIRTLQELCTKKGVPCIVNDRVELAIRAGADGVHVGQSDIMGRDIRAMIGPDRILGITAKTVAQARAAEASGADYIGTGAVFGSSTKTDALAMSVEQFRAITDAVHIPVVAIGGIHADNVRQLAGSGAAGIAVVSGIFASGNPKAAAAELRKLSDELFSAR